MSLHATPSQTVGPYYRLGLEPLYRAQIAPEHAAGTQVQISGCVFDGAGMPVSDAVLELWQADAAGIYAHAHDPRCAAHDPSFDGWGRVPTDAQGRYRLSTIRPGPVAGPNRLTAGGASGRARVHARAIARRGNAAVLRRRPTVER